MRGYFHLTPEKGQRHCMMTPRFDLVQKSIGIRLLSLLLEERGWIIQEKESMPQHGHGGT